MVATRTVLQQLNCGGATIVIIITTSRVPSSLLTCVHARVIPDTASDSEELSAAGGYVHNERVFLRARVDGPRCTTTTLSQRTVGGVGIQQVIDF